MERLLDCPTCEEPTIDLTAYRSMIVVAKDCALFTVKCPRCGTVVSSVHSIPSALQDEVVFAAAQVGAGMSLGD